MAALMKSTNDILFWDVNFFRGVHAQELEAMSGFMNTIYGSSIRGFGEDKMCWKPSRDMGFKVNDYYRILDCCFREMLDEQFTKKEGLDIGLVLHVQV